MTTTADVIALPVSEQSVSDLLDAMAERDAPLFEVRPWASASLSEEELAGAWEEYREAVRVREGLATGWISWQETAPELTCAGRQETALQMACAEADEALRYLLDGAR
jgi:predicted CopG family antitoxin